jgi:hypothetical protein
LIIQGFLALGRLVQIYRMLDPHVQQQQLWMVLRPWFAFLGTAGFAMLLAAIVNDHPSQYFGWTAMGCAGALSAGLTTQSNRTRICVWIAAVGRTEADKQDALEASRLIWVDVALSDVPNDHGSVREQTVGATLGD